MAERTVSGSGIQTIRLGLRYKREQILLLLVTFWISISLILMTVLWVFFFCFFLPKSIDQLASQEGTQSKAK